MPDRSLSSAGSAARSEYPHGDHLGRRQRAPKTGERSGRAHFDELRRARSTTPATIPHAAARAAPPDRPIPTPHGRSIAAIGAQEPQAAPPPRRAPACSPAPPHSIRAARHRAPPPRARARRRTRASPAPGVGCAPAAASPLPAATLSSTLTLALALAPALAATLTSSLALALAPAPALTPSRHGVLRAALASPSILHAAHDGQPAALCPQVRGHLLALTLITDHGPNPNPNPDQAHGGQPALAQRDGLPCGAGTGQPRALPSSARPPSSPYPDH